MLELRPVPSPERPSGPVSVTEGLASRLARSPARLGLASLPTPVERAAWLDAGAAEVWVKRDDLSSAVYGGGKVRKLEWILANPPYDGSDPIWSIGGIGSHHLVALGLYLRGLGRQLHAFTFEQPYTTHVRTNLAVLASIGTPIWHVRHRAALPISWLAYHLWRRPEIRGRYMTPGASTPLGCLGFVEAGLELAAQIRGGELPHPRRIYVTAGTAGTAAGLAVGLALAGVGTHLALVSSVEPIAFNRVAFGLKLGETRRALLEAGLRNAPDGPVSRWLGEAGITWSIDHTEVGAGYGDPTGPALEAAGLAGEHGLRLETTYTGKCVAAIRRDLAGANPIDGPVLFWNTHGANDLSGHIEEGWEQRLPAGLRRRLQALAPASPGGPTPGP